MTKSWHLQTEISFVRGFGNARPRRGLGKLEGDSHTTSNREEEGGRRHFWKGLSWTFLRYFLVQAGGWSLFLGPLGLIEQHVGCGKGSQCQVHSRYKAEVLGTVCPRNGSLLQTRLELSEHSCLLSSSVTAPSNSLRPRPCHL